MNLKIKFKSDYVEVYFNNLPVMSLIAPEKHKEETVELNCGGKFYIKIPNTQNEPSRSIWIFKDSVGVIVSLKAKEVSLSGILRKRFSENYVEVPQINYFL